MMADAFDVAPEFADLSVIGERRERDARAPQEALDDIAGAYRVDSNLRERRRLEPRRVCIAPATASESRGVAIRIAGSRECS